MLLLIGASSHQAAADLLDRQLQFQGIAVDRILGMPDGTAHFVESGFARAVMAAAEPSGRPPTVGP